jgi:hypothetical protein
MIRLINMATEEPQVSLHKVGKYPHMFPHDINIWERFLDTYGSEYILFDYDIKVGTGVPPESGIAENYARMQDILSKFRIDCVGILPSSIDIIEVKPNASLSAIGQLLSYVELYKRDFLPSSPVRGVIVTDRELPDIRHLTEVHGFGYYVV